MDVPFNRVYTTGSELSYIAEAIAETRLAGNGPFSVHCNGWLERTTGATRALLTHSCTGALEMAVLLADISPGDEVILPSFTFVSTANAVVLRGGVPVFVDVREDTLNINERLVEEAVTRRTRAVMPVHYAGVAAEMDELLAIAERHDLLVLEDAAQALLATHRGRPLGALGHAGALSFHETKNVIAGEGGALLVNHDPWVDRAEVIHEKGTDRRRFFRGQIDKYTWIDVGSSYSLSEVGAAFLWAQLEHAQEITRMRMETWEAYHALLEPLEAREWLRRPIVPPECGHNGHLYWILLPRSVDRLALLGSLREAGVAAVFHYVPLHSSPAGLRFGRTHGSLPVTDDVSERLVRLPLWAGMSRANVEQVADALRVALARQLRSVRGHLGRTGLRRQNR